MELPDLRARIDGDVVLPGDETWDTARQAWNLAVDQRPVAVVYPESADDVVATVGLAAEHGLRIAFNAGGHNAGPIDWTEPTAAAQDRADDAGSRSTPRRAARGSRRASCRSRSPTPPASTASRTSPGTSPECRRARLRARRRPQLAGPDARARVQQHRRGRGRHGRRPAGPRRPRHRARAVLGDPRRRRQRRRGDRDRARAVSRSRRSMPAACSGRSTAPPRSSTRGATWIETVPEACESLGRMLQLPDVPFLPEHLRGRAFVLVELAFIGSAADGDGARPAAAGPRARVRHGRDHAGEATSAS